MANEPGSSAPLQPPPTPTTINLGTPVGTPSSSSAGATPNAAMPVEPTPSTVLTYPLPPEQYIKCIDPDNLPTPPAPILDGVYHMFGQKISLDDAIIAPLEAHGTKRLYPRTEYDHKKELKKINASILVNFLDLIDVLVKCPDTDKRIEKCNDLATLFINFHHLINELRPHQARETLRVWLNAQRRTREEITKKLNTEMDKMNKVVDKFAENYSDLMSTDQQPQQSQQSSSDSLSNQTTNKTNNQQLSQQLSSLQTATSAAPDNNPVNQLPQSTPTEGSSQATVSIDELMCQIVDEACS